MTSSDYEWDDDKAAGNLAEHGVSFAAAAQVFADPLAIARDDPGHHDELRSNIIALLKAACCT